MNKYKTELKWAVIFVITSLVWMLVERLVGLHDEHIDQHAFYTNFFAIPAIAIYVLALIDKRKTFFNGFMTYKEGLITGLILTFIIALFSPFTQYITTTLITPDYFSNAIDYTVETGVMSREAAELYFNQQSYIIQGFVGAVIMGIITSVIVAFFTKKTKTE